MSLCMHIVYLRTLTFDFNVRKLPLVTFLPLVYCIVLYHYCYYYFLSGSKTMNSLYRLCMLLFVFQFRQIVQQLCRGLGWYQNKQNVKTITALILLNTFIIFCMKLSQLTSVFKT